MLQLLLQIILRCIVGLSLDLQAIKPEGDSMIFNVSKLAVLIVLLGAERSLRAASIPYSRPYRRLPSWRFRQF